MAARVFVPNQVGGESKVRLQTPSVQDLRNVRMPSMIPRPRTGTAPPRSPPPPAPTTSTSTSTKTTGPRSPAPGINYGRFANQERVNLQSPPPEKPKSGFVQSVDEVDSLPSSLEEASSVASDLDDLTDDVTSVTESQVSSPQRVRMSKHEKMLLRIQTIAWLQRKQARSPVRFEFDVNAPTEELIFIRKKLEYDAGAEAMIVVLRRALMMSVAALTWLSWYMDYQNLDLKDFDKEFHKDIAKYDDLLFAVYDKYMAGKEVDPLLMLVMTVGSDALNYSTMRFLRTTAPKMAENLVRNRFHAVASFPPASETTTPAPPPAAPPARPPLPNYFVSSVPGAPPMAPPRAPPPPPPPAPVPVAPVTPATPAPATPATPPPRPPQQVVPVVALPRPVVVSARDALPEIKDSLVGTPRRESVVTPPASPTPVLPAVPFGAIRGRGRGRGSFVPNRLPEN